LEEGEGEEGEQAFAARRATRKGKPLLHDSLRDPSTGRDGKKKGSLTEAVRKEKESGWEIVLHFLKGKGERKEDETNLAVRR